MADGKKTTDTEQLAPGANEAPQVLLCRNAAAPVPAIATPEIVSVAVPGFWTAIVCAVLEVPTCWPAKVSTDEETERRGESGEIVNRTTLELPPPGAGLLTVSEPVPLLPRSLAGNAAVKIEGETYVV